MNQGILYCIGIGPGDPELLTLKAKRILDESKVIAVPVTREGRTVAKDIIEPVVSLADKELVYLSFKMVADADLLAKTYDELAEQVAVYLEKGIDVSFINLGDVAIFSTAGHISKRIQKMGYQVMMVPGISSISACAAVLGRSLTEMKAPLHLFPARFTQMDQALALKGTKVFMKSASNIGKVKERILESGYSASAVVDCGMETQQVYHDLTDLPLDAGYFTTIMVYDHWDENADE